MPADRRSIRLIVFVLCAVALATAPGLLAAKEKYSGFLGDYSGLVKQKDALGRTRRVAFSPRLTTANYPKVLLEPLVYHPRPQGNVQVTDEVLARALDYADGLMRKAVGDEFKLVGEPGPGVVRVRAAITGVGVSKGLKPYEYIPVALIAAGIKEAAGARKHKVNLYVEAEFTDSITGETLGRLVRETPGLKFTERKNVLAFEDLRPLADTWGEALRKVLAAPGR